MPNKGKVWVRNPSARTKNQPKIPVILKAEVAAKATELIDSVLRPRYVQPPPDNPQFMNYIVDVCSKWFRNTLFFCATYCVPGPNALIPDFEHRFARMRYTGNDHFDLSFMRHNGEWVELCTDQTADECLTSIQTDSYFEI